METWEFMNLQLKGNSNPLNKKEGNMVIVTLISFFLFQQSIFRMKNETVKTRLVTIFFYRLAMHMLMCS